MNSSIGTCTHTCNVGYFLHIFVDLRVDSTTGRNYHRLIISTVHWSYNASIYHRLKYPWFLFTYILFLF